jgi:RNA-directed DNA polymerase
LSLAALLFSLKPLLDAPAQNLDAIVELLDAHSDLAEYEVARYWVSRSMMPLLAEHARSSDPRQRRQAATGIRLVCTRNRAAQLLRPLVKDPDWETQARARHAMRALELDEVALPDTHFKPPRRPSRTAIGGWNPTGWCFGLFGSRFGWMQVRRDRSGTTKKTLIDKYNLPALENEAAVATWLGVEPVQGQPKTKKQPLRRFLRPGSGTGSPYVEFEIPKSSGAPRKITAPRPALKRIQRKILAEILAKLPVHAACHGFVRGRSVVTNATPHAGAKLVIKMDLRDFFPTIHYRRVRGLFAKLGYSPEVASVLAGLTTHRDKLADGLTVWPGVLPQGAPTSPALANILCLRLDARLSGLAARAGAVYTRYADDLTFSFRAPPDKGIGGFLWWVDQICQQEGFIENTAKRRILWPSSQQLVTGVVVNSALHIPRPARHQFRALLHNCRMDGLFTQSRGRKDFRAYLLGFASYVKMVQPRLGSRLLTEVRALLRGASTDSSAS